LLPAHEQCVAGAYIQFGLRSCKTLMEGKTKSGRPKRECLDNVKEWCNEEMYILKRKAQDRDAWKMIFKCALDTNG